MSETREQEYERLKREEEERKRQAQQQTPSFSLSDLFSWMPSFGTIITGLIVMTGLYFIAKQPGVQDWIGKTFGEDWKKWLQGLSGNADNLIGNAAAALGFGDYVNDAAANKPVTEIQQTMREQGLPEEAIAALAGTQEVWKGTVDIIKRGKGVVTDPISDKTIFAFLTDPEGVKRLQQIVGSVKLGGPMDEKQKAFAAKLSAAFAPILADDRLDQLLTTYRASTLPLLLQFSPVPFDADKLGAALQKIAIGADGKVTAPFRELLTSLTRVTGDAAADSAAQLAALQKFISSSGVDGASLKLFFQSVDVSKMPQGPLKTMMTQLQNATPQAVKAQIDLATGPVPIDVLSELKTLAERNPALALDRVMNDANLRQQMIDGDMINKLGRTIQAEHDASTDPVRRGQLSFLTTQLKSKPGNYVNLQAMFGLVDDLANNAYNIAPNGLIGQRAQTVMHALVGAMTATTPAARSKALASVTPEQLALFFKNPANSAAFGKFLGAMNETYLPPQQRAMVAALRAHYGALVRDNNGTIDAAQSHGLAEILADPAAAKVLLDAMKSPSTDAKKYTAEGLGWTLWGAGILGGVAGIPNVGALSENRADVIAVLQAAGVVSAASTTEANAQSIMRSRGGLGILG